MDTVNAVADALLIKVEWILNSSAPDLIVSTGFRWAEHENLSSVTTPLKMIHTVKMCLCSRHHIYSEAVLESGL